MQANGCAIVPPVRSFLITIFTLGGCSVAIKLIVVAAVLTLSGVVGLAQSKPSIQGVWRKAEVTVTNPSQAPNALPKGTHTDVQPGVLIFTAKHYSVINDTGGKPRPKTPFKVQGKPTAEEMQTQWGPFQANAGTYELTGTSLTLRPIVAKNPALQGGGVSRYNVKHDGNNLWLTQVEVSTVGKVENQPVVKYTRVE